MTHYEVAIIGAGFCGTMVAVNLCRFAPQVNIALIEGNGQHGPGLAYATADIDHLLNVRAGQMGAFPDSPDDFWNWLEVGEFKNRYSKDDFVPRQIYGRYIRHLLEQARTTNHDLALLTQRIINITPTPVGFELIADDGMRIAANKVVLALGNFPPDQLGQGKARNPYDPAIWKEIADDGDVLIIGTGLTSLDLVVTLAKTKKAGIVHLLSRHGFLPREHVQTKPYSVSLNEAVLPRTALALLRAVRKEIAFAADKGLSWHSAIDALRPLNQQLWQVLKPDEKRCFLRHLRAYWDVHRHRCATQVMDAYRQLEKANRLELHHGPIIAQTPTGNGWHIEWRQRRTSQIESFNVRHVVSCTGPQADFCKLNDPLVQNLLHSGLITSDPLNLGISTGDTYVALGKDGQFAEGLYALGSVLKGRLYESVAVPELRMQAADVASRLAEKTA